MLRFLSVLQPRPGEPILDVGGTPALWAEIGYTGPIVYVNIIPRDRMPPIPEGSQYVQADACALPFGRHEFPIVFSNSVVEHVGQWTAQQRCASEISRVGLHYWVQTPNRRFPIEPHVNFPFFQWLPAPVARRLVTSWPLSFHRRDGLSAEEARRALEQTRLLTVADMRNLFPDASIWRETVFGLTKSIVAVRA